MVDKSSERIFERAQIWNNPNPLMSTTGLHKTIREKKPGNTPNYQKVQEIQQYFFPLYDLPNETSKYDMKNSRLLMRDINGNLLYKY